MKNERFSALNNDNVLEGGKIVSRSFTGGKSKSNFGGPNESINRLTPMNSISTNQKLIFILLFENV